MHASQGLILHPRLTEPQGWEGGCRALASVLTLPISSVKAFARSQLKGSLQKKWDSSKTEQGGHRNCLGQTEGKVLESKMQCGMSRLVKATACRWGRRVWQATFLVLSFPMGLCCMTGEAELKVYEADFFS